MQSLIFTIRSALVSLPTSPTTIWSASWFGIASRILFSTCLSVILQASCQRSKRAHQADHCISLHSSSSAGIAALLFAPPAPPPSPPPAAAGCIDRMWFDIARRMSLRSCIALFTTKLQSVLSQSLITARSAGSIGAMVRLFSVSPQLRQLDSTHTTQPHLLDRSCHNFFNRLDIT